MGEIPSPAVVAAQALAAIDALAKADEEATAALLRSVGANPRMARLRGAVDLIVAGKRLSYREAAILQAQYKSLDPSLDVTARIKGGRTAAQKLSEGLAERGIACTKDAFTAAALGHGSRSLVQGAFEGWDNFIRELNELSDRLELRAIRDYVALRLAGQRMDRIRLEPLPAGLLTFGDFQELLSELLALKSQGAVQQFLVAALLKAFNAQLGTGLTVRTKNIFAADKFAGTIGDIQVVDERDNDRIVDAYEVTLRGWAARLAEVEEKAVSAGLDRIHILAEVTEGPGPISRLLRKHRAVDTIVLDLGSFSTMMAAVLKPDFRQLVLRETETLLASADRLWSALASFQGIVANFALRKAQGL